jgi:hypothetical protein
VTCTHTARPLWVGGIPRAICCAEQWWQPTGETPAPAAICRCSHVSGIHTAGLGACWSTVCGCDSFAVGQRTA